MNSANIIYYPLHKENEISNVKSQRIAFGETLVELIDQNPRILILDGDLANSTKVDIVTREHPEHSLEMGIAEQTLMGVAAGLAAKQLLSK